MSDKIDTSDEACAVMCMLVSNPMEAMRKDGDGWQKRVNDLIRALRDERNELRNLVFTLNRRLVLAGVDAQDKYAADFVGPVGGHHGTTKDRALTLLQSSSCYRGDVCGSFPCACAETIAKFAEELASQATQGRDPSRKDAK